MKAEKRTSNLLSLLIASTLILLTLFTTEAFAGPSDTGSFTKCTYTAGLSDSGYSSAKIYYPCETSYGPFAATTLTGGDNNTKEDMTWLSNHIVTHGFIVIAITPKDIYGDNSQWRTAHKAGINKLISENSRFTSPINGLVKTSKLQIMGFSKGGGGALLASSDLGTKIASTQALAPYMDSLYDLKGIQSPTICYTGTNDSTASFNKVVAMFYELPENIDHTVANFLDVSHMDWNNYGNYQDRLKTYVTGWMHVYLNDNVDFRSYIAGSQDWFQKAVRPSKRIGKK